LKTSRSFSADPRWTVSRYVPSGTAAGRNTTSCVLVALMIVIGCVWSHTCGGALPNAIPSTVSV
jgi:hypothetical protein